MLFFCIVLKGPLASASFDLDRQKLRRDRFFSDEVVAFVPTSLVEPDFRVFVVYPHDCSAILDLKRNLVFVSIVVELE